MCAIKGGVNALSICNIQHGLEWRGARGGGVGEGGDLRKRGP